jgi:excinuclease Cho
MPPPRRRNPEFDETRYYEYPIHLRAMMDDLPNSPGVYIFHGQEGDLPVYIGKSVNIRSRVLSHLRTEDEARMLRQTQRISHICTAGEIGALLLEASLIKQLHPLFNQKLRRTRQLYAWTVIDGRAQLVHSKDVDFAVQPDLFGLYASRHAAVQALRAVADLHKLCYGAIGLEKLQSGKACFRSMVHQCTGVCCGKESTNDHTKRFLDSLETLRVACWPYPGSVGLVERHEGRHCQYQMHVINHWCYLGSVGSPDSAVVQAKALAKQAAGFDADGYKILCRPLLGGQAEVVPLW